MRDEFGQCSLQRAFSEENQPREALLFDRAHPSFSVDIQIQAPRRNSKRLDAVGRQHIVECGTEFGIPVVQHVPTLPQRAGNVINGIARVFKSLNACSHGRYCPSAPPGCLDPGLLSIIHAIH